MSALISLVANNLTIREHNLYDQLDEDKQLIREGLHFVQNMSTMLDDEKLRQLYVACSELAHRGTVAVVSFKSNKSWSKEIGPWLSTTHQAGLGGTDGISSFSAPNLIRAFAGANVESSCPSISLMWGLGDIVY